jgi:hypothetical protein
MNAQFKALLCLGGLAFCVTMLSGQTLDVVHLEEVELTVYDLKSAFDESLKTASQSLENNPEQFYRYQERIEHGTIQSALTRQFGLTYALAEDSTDLNPLEWNMLDEEVAQCTTNRLPYPDLLFLNQTLHLKFYQRLFLQFVDRLVITEESLNDKHIRLGVASKALGAIDRLSAQFEIDKQTKHINRINLSLLIDPNYEVNTHQWHTRTLVIEISFQNGIASSYEAHTALNSTQKRVLKPLIFRQQMQAFDFQTSVFKDTTPVQIDLKKALKPNCLL